MPEAQIYYYYGECLPPLYIFLFFFVFCASLRVCISCVFFWGSHCRVACVHRKFKRRLSILSISKSALTTHDRCDVYNFIERLGYESFESTELWNIGIPEGGCLRWRSARRCEVAREATLGSPSPELRPTVPRKILYALCMRGNDEERTGESTWSTRGLKAHEKAREIAIKRVRERK